MRQRRVRNDSNSDCDHQLIGWKDDSLGRFVCVHPRIVSWVESRGPQNSVLRRRSNDRLDHGCSCSTDAIGSISQEKASLSRRRKKKIRSLLKQGRRLNSEQHLYWSFRTKVLLLCWIQGDPQPLLCLVYSGHTLLSLSQKCLS